MVETYLAVLEEGFYEAKIAFEGLSDANVWKRPAPGLLSVGELAGHVAYWEAVKLAGEGGEPVESTQGSPPSSGIGQEPDPAKCRVSSLLIDARFSYYPTTISTLPSDEHLAMTAEQVCSELMRVHNESVAYFKTLNADLDSCPPGWPAGNTYRAFLSYAVFHVSYHTGQIYSARHLLGEETPDN